ncbi:MAG: hypothetical protein IIY78_08120 [Clostridia bacterium]|nr:hypothetical protein [Clostridia bacterium]
MVTLLIGKKGSGKTKRLIEEANATVKTSNGNVVVIEKGAKLTYDLTYKARLVDADAFKIKGYDALYGFLSGMCAGNYDITDIFVDSTFKIAGDNKDELKKFVDKLNELSAEANTAVTLLISASKDELPTDINATLEEL